MASLVLTMTMSLDGFFSGPAGELDWMAQAPDPEFSRDTVSFFDRFDPGFIGYPTPPDLHPPRPRRRIRPHRTPRRTRQRQANIHRQDQPGADRRQNLPLRRNTHPLPASPLTGSTQPAGRASGSARPRRPDLR